MAKEPLALVSAQVDKVLGEYDHSLKFPENEEFVIVYGPNGVGKTKFLEIVHAICRVDGRTLARLPFASATLRYSDGSLIRVWRSEKPSDADADAEVETRLHFALERPDQDEQYWDYTGDGFEAWLAENTAWRPLKSDVWEDRRDGELVSFIELEARYPEGKPSASDIPNAFKEFGTHVSSFLIETQRLRIEQYMGRRGLSWRMGSRVEHSSKITDQAAKMRSLVNDAQTEHSRITQQLDRTFPNRVLEASTDVSVADSYTDHTNADLIRARYNEQNEFRSRLGRVVSVALEDALSLPDRSLLKWELQLLSLYLDDTDKKLAPFVSLLQKIELLEKIINSRLLNKRLQVTAGEGLKVVHDKTRRTIDLDSLSSGEQHEVILMFDLLFNVPPGALVLIDEPEISLHVIWQLAFIPDVQRIAELSGFRFVVATHSPQIINDAWERSIRLGPPEVAFS